MEVQNPPVPRQGLLVKLRQRLRRPADSTQTIRRRRKLIDSIVRNLSKIIVALFLGGYIWMLVIPSPTLERHTYGDENALMMGQVNTEWNWGDVHVADTYLAQLEQIRDRNMSSQERANFLRQEFSKLGISASTQGYSFVRGGLNITGNNAYALISAPRHSGTEAMVVSASWISRLGEEDGTINIRGVATVLALANFLKNFSYWGKDIVLVVSDGYLDGMQAWLAAYHGVSQPGLSAEPLEFQSGVVWTALNIDYPGHSFSHLGLFFEGLNGRLPNQDLLNTVNWVSRYTAGVPVILYDNIEPPSNQAPSWLPGMLHAFVEGYIYRAKSILIHATNQANGRGSGVHGLFHQFRVDAITLFAVPATGPHGFHAIGKTIESALRSMNNLLERLHASFFFYIMTDSQHFLKIGLYLPSAIMVSVAMMFYGLRVWVDAAWVLEVDPSSSEKSSLPVTTWRARKRPTLPVLSIMAATHLIGLGLFTTLASSSFLNNSQALSAALVAVLAAIPALFVSLWRPPAPSTNDGSVRHVLKALNLCFASTVISIITVLNFSLAASLALLLGIPLSVSSPSLKSSRTITYLAFSLLGMGWLLIAQPQVLQSLWYWKILGVWYAPFMCIVYVPLVLQSMVVCLLP
ncbi:hypothetical protein D9619_005915 [Psilocybe cf. subviscida]|uniref:Gaa1-domain-containing protein n=1 Tax=Psilocybe cf. subviscida TaxID=2480587 RepID=A0A8H5BY34_9AGAR|nr:hypothetical protein D9619_005915 [Psilocybe cf. subviscida]